VAEPVARFFRLPRTIVLLVEDSRAEGGEAVTTVMPEAGVKAGPVASVLAALALLFLTAVAVLVMVEIAGGTPCYDANRDPTFVGDCFEGSTKRKVLALVLGAPGALLVGVSVVLLFVFAARARGIRGPLVAGAAGILLLAAGWVVAVSG
jgi:hypothetical protein